MAFGPLPSSIENFLTWQARAHAASPREEKAVQPGPFVTVSRAYGCEGAPLAEALAARLNAASARPTPWVVMGKDIIEAVAAQKGASAEFVEALARERRGFIEQTVGVLLGNRPTEYQAYQTLVRALLALAHAGRVILLGRGGVIACAEAPRGYHVRLVAPLGWRAGKIARTRGIGLPQAEAVALREEEAREAFVRDFTGKDAAAPEHYDLVLNNGRNTVGEMAGLIAAALKEKGYA
ncbi:MAG: cytidylate kinase-like family protein [Candidatus Tectomicrobia bacterium]|uniref:Cytidylate kinase-like family protein n=1 Tax=Tectimicrobiota bacterium TaxID=2528274 RepID=A0A932MQ41_UNCTE|nr:cytidylate kinase-like family protein [Candidatus Tectomicrobia bacterium]